MKERRHGRRPGTNGRPVPPPRPPLPKRPKSKNFLFRYCLKAWHWCGRKIRCFLDRRQQVIDRESPKTRKAWTWAYRILMLILAVTIIARARNLYNLHQEELEVKEQIRVLQEEKANLQKEK